MSSIGVDGLVEREVGAGIVVRDVQGGGGDWKGVGKARDPFFEVAFALGCGYWRAGTVVVVE